MTAENLRFSIMNMHGWLSGTRVPGGPRGVVWLEVDRARAREKLIDPVAMRALSRTESLSLRFIAGVEAGHRGPLPISDLAGVLVIDGVNLMPVNYYERVTSDTVRRVEALPIVVAEPTDPLRRLLARSAFDRIHTLPHRAHDMSPYEILNPDSEPGSRRLDSVRSPSALQRPARVCGGHEDACLRRHGELGTALYRSATTTRSLGHGGA